MKNLITTFGLLLLLTGIVKAQNVIIQVTSLKKIMEYDMKSMALKPGRVTQCNGCHYEDTVRYVTVLTITKVIDSAGNPQDYPIEERILTVDSFHGDLKGLSDDQALALYLRSADSFINPSDSRSGQKYHVSGTYPLVRFDIEVPHDLFRSVGGRIQRTHLFIVQKKSTSLIGYLVNLLDVVFCGFIFGYAFLNKKRGFWKDVTGKKREEKLFRRIGLPLFSLALIVGVYASVTEHLTGSYYIISLLVGGSLFLVSALMIHGILRWLSRQVPKIQEYLAKRRSRTATTTG